jgi:energy-coupling factor transport system permease protein
MAFRLYVYLACFIVTIRILLRIVFSAQGPTVLFHLPTLTLPGILDSVRLFGPVSAEALLGAGISALQLAAMVVAIGAANALANPKRLLAAVPGALYEWGTVVVIALSIFPQLAESFGRVRRARQLRAETGKGAHLIKNVAMPVLSDGLDRSLVLAAAMDSRGYGRSMAVSVFSRRLTSVLLVVSSLALCVGAYGLLDTGFTPLWMGVPMVVFGLVAGLVGLRLSGRRVVRSRYRPDTMLAAEWLVLGSGVAACVGILILGIFQPMVAFPPVSPLGWPDVSILAIGTIVVLLLPAFMSPPAETPSTRVVENPHKSVGFLGADTQNGGFGLHHGENWGENPSISVTQHHNAMVLRGFSPLGVNSGEICVRGNDDSL